MTKSKILSPKILFSCFLASMLEIYDFVIFGFLSAVLHKNYLTFLDAETAIIVTYAFLAIGFVFRPIGSLIFGYIGDVKGRKSSLVTSVSMMGLASFIMFALPTYQTIGVLSCYIIVMVRIIQGISVGGEYTGAIIFAAEHCKENNTGFITGIVTAGAASGVLLAIFVGKMLSNPIMPEYSWRFAFLIGFGLAIVGFFIRKKLSDTPEFLDIKKAKLPLLEGMPQHKIESIASTLGAAANGAVFYFGTVYLFKLVKSIRIEGDFSYIPLLVSVVAIVTMPIFGLLSDKVNRKSYIIFSMLLMTGFLLFGLTPMIQSESIFILNLGIVIYALLTGILAGPINIFAVEIFPTKYRMSCGSLCYSIGMGFLGGTVPMVASFIAKYFGEDTAYITQYLAFLCILATIATIAVLSKEKR